MVEHFCKYKIYIIEAVYLQLYWQIYMYYCDINIMR
ncbi:hypothetical protein EV202_102148 [Bacteroides heparinolyticus]|uniref:Uncharacterized protein n=1 Tax=Prevotella heparinolytica TaxID=28113 RepID=A0A4R2LX10_9BACE|nr:hypothetical protein EV202_102148 [Bacteroides heparinolyticus]